MKRATLRAGLSLGAYNALYHLAYLCVRPGVRAGLLGRDWRWQERTGRYAELEQPPDGRGVWIHAASVGEAKAAAALVSSLRERSPGVRIVVSALTPAGMDTARNHIPEAEAIVQAPFDLKGPVTRALSWFEPSLLLLVETEIWPNMILECHRRGTAVAIISARISHNSFRRYRVVRSLMRHVLSAVTCVAAQNEIDKERFCFLGLDPARVEVTGDVKLDAESSVARRDPPSWLTEILPAERGLLFAAGSTRPGEEEIIGRALLSVTKSVGGSLTVVVAPRHVHRCRSVAERFRRLGFNVALRSALTSEGWSGGSGLRILVLDTIGELGGVYSWCDIAFVGGTLKPHGGHNLAEPAEAGVPVLFGPNVDGVRTVAGALLARGGGVMVAGEESLGVELGRLLANDDERRQRGRSASRALRSLRGACGRTMEFLDKAGVLPPEG